MRQSLIPAALAVLLTACAPQAPRESFSKLAEEYVYTSLSFSPVGATQVGYHKHNNVALDYELDDVSPSSIERQRRWYQEFRQRLLRVSEDLGAEDQADYDILQDQISANLLELDTIQNYKHNPAGYVELAGNALYAPFILEYTDKSTRFKQIISRMQKMPLLMDQAKRNLETAPEVWTKVAQAENEGNIALIDTEMRAAVPAEVKSEYDVAADTALAALRGFNTYLKNTLSQTSYPWQLGKSNYDKKFHFILETDQNPEQVLRAAEEELKKGQQEMYRLSLPIWQKLHPDERKEPEMHEAIRAALNEIVKNHSTPESFFADTEKDLAEATAFVKEKDLLTLPPRSNLKVIPTPEFMRGIYAVGGFSAAPPLEPQLGAFYWITPIPKDWPAERVESKLREDNVYGLKILTIHEAMPGHYVQLEYANDIQPPLRRVIRAVFGNGAYVEGWAVYATQMMLDEGYMNNDPGMRLAFLKNMLRVYANTILDVRFHTMGMTDQEAMDLMLNETFQERQEATAKLQRAKLSSVQLPTYFVGWRDWNRLRERYKETQGANYKLKEFNERALKEGSVPLPVLNHLLTGKAL